MIKYVKFEDWLKEQVIDAEYLLPEAKKAFRENYEKLKAEGNLPKAKQAEKDTKYELEKFQNPDGSLNIDYALETARQSLAEHREKQEGGKNKRIPQDLSKLTPKDFSKKDGKIDIDFALKVAMQAAAQSKKE